MSARPGGPEPTLPRPAPLPARLPGRPGSPAAPASLASPVSGRGEQGEPLMGRVEGSRVGGAWAPSPEGAGALVRFLLRSQETRLEIGIFFSNYVFIFE